MKRKFKRDLVRSYSPVIAYSPEGIAFEERLKAICRGTVTGLAIVVALGLGALICRGVVALVMVTL